MDNASILKAQKELNDLYGTCQLTGKMDEQSFVSLRQAIQIEYQKNHKNIKLYTVQILKNNWHSDNQMRKTIINEFKNSLSNYNPMIKLARIALTFHGYDTDLTNQLFSESLTYALNDFSNDLGVGSKDWGMGWYDDTWMTLLTPVDTQLDKDSIRQQSVRRAQQMLNKVVNYLIEHDSDNELLKNDKDPNWMGHDLILTKTNGINNTETKLFMRLVLDYYRLYDGCSPLSLKDYLKKEFSDDFGNKENLVNVGLVLANYLNQGDQSIDDISYPDRDRAIDDFKAFYQVDGGDFFVALFLDDHHQLTAKKIDFIGSLNKFDDSVSGLQSFYFDQTNSKLYFDQLHKNKQDELIRDNDIYKMNFSLGGTNRKLTFNDTDLLIKSIDYLQSKTDLQFGHTQTLFAFDNKIFTGCNYNDKRKFTEKSNCWCKDIIIINQDNPDNYKIITGIFDVVKSLGGNGEPYRTEMAISSDRKHVLFTPIDKDYKQWFLLYNYSDIIKALSKSNFGQALDLTEVKHVDKFKVDNFTKSKTAVLKSVQGYAIDNDAKIYISSARAPKFKKGKLTQGNSPSIILKMHWNHKATMQKYYLNLLPLDTSFFDQIGELGKNVLILGELEDLQYLKDGSIMLAVTWHVLKNDPSIVSQPDFKITNDYINLNRISDRIDLYQIKLD